MPGMGLKEIYRGMENGYYSFLDSLDAKGIPVYKIIDPIDKIVPSLALLLGFVALVIIAGLFLLIAPMVVPQASTLKINVADEGGTPIYRAKVTFTLDEKTTEAETDYEGMAQLENAAVGKKVSVSAGKGGYLTESAEIEITEAPVQLRTITLKEESAAYETKTIRLVDSAGASLMESFVLKFTCSNPYAEPPADVYLQPSDYGTATVRVPTNCETLRVTVKDGTGYADYGPVDVSGSDKTITLSAAERGKGMIIAYVSGEEGTPLNGITVNLYRYDDIADNPNVGPIDSEYSYGGKAEFSKAAGSYVLRTYDEEGTYGEQQSPKIVLIDGDTVSYGFTLSANVKGSIKIKVTDADTDEAIENADVTLAYESSGNELAGMKTDEDGLAEFNISRDETYKATAYAEGYSLGTLSGLRKSADQYTIELEKCTPSRCGTLKVLVIDEENVPVQNAIVVLYDAGKNWLTGYGERLSDINGVAEFKGVSSGNYWAFAFKESASGRSDAAYFSSRSQGSGATLTVAMQIGQGVIRARITDKYGEPVPFAGVDVRNAADGGEIGASLGDANGIFTIETKADKRVYLVVSKKEGMREPMADYVTVSKAVSAGSIAQFDVVMEPEIIDRDVEVKFLGLFNASGEAKVLSAGGEYTAKFQVRVPEEADYSEAGVHIRTGDALIMEKDGIYIKSINVPEASAIKAAAYDEASGMGEADYSLTAGDAKWASIVWQNPAAGIYEVWADVKAKETASVGDKLVVHYRAWADNSERVFDPKNEKAGVEELYYTTRDAVYEVGVQTFCAGDFCFSATITDLDEGLIESVSEGYAGGIFRDYKLFFTLTNNSATRIHDNANLRIKNPEKNLLLADYSVFDAEGENLSGTINGYELPRLDVGNLSPNKKVAGTINFTTQKAGSGTVNIRLVSDESIVFEKNLVVSVGAAGELDVSVQPSSFPSGIENDINVLVLDKETRLEIEKAIVRIKDKHDNVIMLSKTGKDGYAYLTLPAQSPGTVLRIEAEKQGYDVKTLEVNISSAVLSVNPQAIGVSLNAKTKAEAEDRFSLTNATFFPLKITEIKLIGNLKGLIDMERVSSWLEANYVNLTLASAERKELSLRTYLSDEGMALEDRDSLDAELKIIAGNFGQKWQFVVPVKISIGMGGEVDNPACLALTRREWKTTTQGNDVSVEFGIQNNCTIAGNPAELRDLGGMLEVTGNQLGSYKITIVQNETELRSGYFRTLLGRMDAEQAVSAVVTFTPYGGVNGKSSAKIVLRAVNPLEGENQVLTVSMDTEIVAVNIKECISFDREIVDALLEKPQAGKQNMLSQFTITTKGCGDKIDFELESELRLSDTDFTMQADDTHKIDVMYSDVSPGQYPIKVYKTGKGGKELLKNLKVRLWEAGCLQLNRYEFEIYDDAADPFDGYDSAELQNTCYNKEVTVSVDMKDWKAAMKEGSNWALVLFAGSLLSKAGSALGESKWLPSWLGGSGGMWFGSESSKTETAKATECGVIEAQIKSLTEQWNSLCSSQELRSANQSMCEGIRKDLTAAETQKVKLGCGKAASQATGNLTLVGMLEGNEYEMPAITGLATGAETYALGGIASFLMGSGGLGGAMSMITNVITGKSNPLTSGVLGFLAGTVMEYMQQKDFEFVTVQKDLETQGIKLLAAKGDAAEPAITAAWYGDARYEKNPANTKLKFEFREIRFENVAGAGVFVTSNEEPAYRTLTIGGIQHNYRDKTYKKDDFEIMNEKSWFGFQGGTEKIDTGVVKLDEDAADKVEKKYHLEFNSIPPGDEGTGPTAPQNCQAGTRTGSTGAVALPRVSLNWNWSSIAADACDQGNDNYIYCDATQFGIEVLKKVHDIDDWLLKNASRLECPSAEGATGTNSAEIGSYDIGVSRISAKRAGSDINVSVEITNTNPAKVKTTLEVKVTDSEGKDAGDVCRFKEFGVLSKEPKTCTFTLAAGKYRATATITPKVDCENCANKTASDSLATEFQVGSAGVAECEPYSTARLDEFVAASGIRGAEEILGKVSFKAYLIKDRYTADFQRDFDDYAKTRSFFNAAEWYRQKDRGLGSYFKNAELFSFKPKYGEANPEGLALVGPGLYDVKINIKYEDRSWALFDGKGLENAQIDVELERLDTPEPDSPFYYMPFDGPIGEDSGRVGYGVNYKGEEVTLNSGAESVRTVEIPGSTPISNGLVEVEVSDNFSRLNGSEKGTILTVTRGQNPKIAYTPSYATPVMMKITKGTAKDNEAWGFYSLAIDGKAASARATGAAQWTGTYMARWNGVGYNCRDFDDRSVIESFYESADQHGLRTECALLGGDISMTSYGFEFCDVTKFGNLYLKTIFYTPQGHSALMRTEVSKDGMGLFSGGMANASMVQLNGVQGMPYNQHGTQGITSVQNMFDLVRDGYACVSSSDTKAEFWWNPAKIYLTEEFQKNEDMAVQDCIKGS
ncbi:MAG: carboxypeptidase-like regulatory domain-containing protein [Candidatus Diapherotrites archaeon]